MCCRDTLSDRRCISAILVNIYLSWRCILLVHGEGAQPVRVILAQKLPCNDFVHPRSSMLWS